MLKKNWDEIMYLSGQKWAVDDLERQTEEHVFSGRYERKKQALLDGLSGEETVNGQKSAGVVDKENADTGKKKARAASKRGRWHRGAVAAALVLLVSTLSVTVYAAAKYMLVDKNEQGNVLTVGLSAGESGETEYQVPELAFDLGYVPDGYSQWQQGYYSEDGQYGGRGFYIRQWQGLDTTFEYLENRSTTTINGMSAYCYEVGEENGSFNCKLQVLYNDSGAMYELTSDSEAITMDELIKIAENMTVTETGEMIAVYTEEELTQTAEIDYIDIPASHILSAGQTAVHNDFEITMNQVTVTDDLSGLEEQYFYDYDGKIAPLADENGRLSDFAAVYNQYDENGVQEVTVEESLKALRVSFTVTNTSNETREYAVNDIGLICLEENHSGDYGCSSVYDKIPNYKNGLTDFYLPVYFDQPQYVLADERTHYFFVDLAAGETLEYETVYVVYGDLLDQLYLQTNLGGRPLAAASYGNEDASNPPVWFWKVENNQ